MCKLGCADLDVLGQLEAGELEVGGGSAWQVDEQEAVHMLLVLIEDHHVREAPRCRILHNLFDGRPLRAKNPLSLQHPHVPCASAVTSARVLLAVAHDRQMPSERCCWRMNGHFTTTCPFLKLYPDIQWNIILMSPGANT